MNDTGIRTIGELPVEVPPGRDLWPAIAARIVAERAASHASAAPADVARPLRGARTPLALFAVAASVALVGLGLWLGRASLPGLDAAGTGAAAGSTLLAAYQPGSRFVAERAALRRDAEVRLAALPPRTRAKVAASLQSIDHALRDIEAALGQDPANALLQELLVNTYQDEMRVLSELQTTGTVGQEI
jgi:hypothetical protein